MDITQLLITSASVVGIAVVGAMAVLPSAMEAWAARGGPRTAPPARTPSTPGTARRSPARRHRPTAVDLAA